MGVIIILITAFALVHGFGARVPDKVSIRIHWPQNSVEPLSDIMERGTDSMSTEPGRQSKWLPHIQHILLFDVRCR